MNRELLLMKIAEKFGALKVHEEANRVHFDYAYQFGSNRLAIIWNLQHRPDVKQETNIFITDEEDLDILHQVISNILDGCRAVRVQGLEDML